MTKFEIEMPATHDVASRGKVVTVDIAKLSPDIVAKLVLHGLTQKVADAAAGAKKAAGDDADDDKIADTAWNLMDAVAKRLESGDWGVERGAGVAGDPLDKFRLSVMRDIMKTPQGTALKAKFDKTPKDEQRAMLLEVAAKNAEIVDREAIKRRDAAKPAIALEM